MTGLQIIYFPCSTPVHEQQRILDIVLPAASSKVDYQGFPRYNRGGPRRV